MSLLKKFAAVAPVTTRETVYGTVLSIVPAKPAFTESGDALPKSCVSISFGTDGTRDFYMFNEQIAGAPAMIPNGGLPCQVVLQESKPDKEGKTYLNAAYVGVGA